MAAETREQTADELVVDTADERRGDVDHRAERAVAQPDAAVARPCRLVTKITQHVLGSVECRGGREPARGAAQPNDLLAFLASRSHRVLASVVTRRGLCDGTREDPRGQVVATSRDA